MASTQATIDLVVRGSNAVNKLIQNVGQLQSAVDKINSQTLNVATPGLQRRANTLSATMQGASARANDLGRDRTQILSEQRQVVERLTQAQTRQQQAIERTASAERELSRLASRNELFSRRTDSLKTGLRESAAEAERLGEEMSAASAAARVLESRLSAIRNAGRRSISAAGDLININTTLAGANAVNALADQYNRYGDSLRRSARESRLVGTVLPGQINNFNQFRNQIEQTEASLASLRAELRRLGTVEAAIDIPVRSLSQGEQSTPMSPSELGRVQAAQQENRLREQRNARRAQLASEIAAQEAGLATLEKRTETVGRNIARNQETAARLIANRDPANTTGLGISLNQIQAQAESLALVANNSQVASTAFNRFTVAAEMASVKLARTQQNTFAALAAGFSGGGGANMPAGLGRPEEVAGARSLVGQVVTEMPTFATGASEAALNGYINMLQSLKAIVPGLSIEYRALEEAIARANEEMRSAQLDIVGAPSSRLGSLEAVTQRQKSEERAQKVQEKRQKNINDVFEKQNDIVDQINSSRLSGDEKASFRERAERAVNALIEDRLEDSKEMTRLIERQLKASMDLLKAKPPQVFGIADKDFFSVTGKLADGGFAPGSPATDIEERKSFDRQFKEQSDLLKGVKQRTEETKRAGGQLSSQALQLEKLQKRLVEVEIDGVDVSKNKAVVEKLIADIKSGQIPTSKQSVDLVAKELKDARTRLGISQSQAKIDGKIADVLKGAVGGPSKKIDDLAAQQKYATAINDTYRQTEDILTKISEASISTTRKLALAGNVEQARYELYENRLENAQGITKEVERQLKLETAMQKGAGGGRKTSAADPLKEESEARRIISTQLEALKDIQTRYTIEERKGVQLANEKIELGRIINAIAKDEVAFTKDNTKAIGESIRTLNALGRYAKNRAIEQGTYAGGSKTGGTKSGVTTAEQLEARRGRLLDSARGGLSQLIDLERKGVVVSDERLKVEQAISDIQSLRGKASKDELVTLAQKVIAAKDFAKGMAIDLKAGALPGAGLQAALQSLQEARQGRQQFLGAMSPAEGIDKIVREFNTGKPVAQNLASTFAQNIQSGSGEMAKAATSAFTAVKNAIEKVWKINSPSGVIIEIVKNIVSTFIAEVLAAGPSVRSAVEDTFNSKGIDRDYGDIGTRNPRTPGPVFGVDPNVALRLGGGRATGGYPPARGIFAPGSTPPIGGFGSGYPFFPPYQMSGAKQLPTPGMKGAQFPVNPMVDLRRNRPEDTSKVVTERIKQFRVDRDNFWQDRDLESKDFWATEFDAVSRALKSGAQLSLARLARRLQQSKVLTPDQEFKQVANEARSLLPAGGSSELSGIVARAKQGVERLSEFFKSIGDFVSPNYDDLSREPAKQIRRGIFAEGGSTFGKTFVSGQGEDRYKLGYSEGMLGIPDDLQDIPLEGGDKIKNAVKSFYEKIVKTLEGGFGGPGGPRPPAGGLPGGAGGGGQGGQAQQAANLLGLGALGNVSRISTRELETLSATFAELRATLDPTIQGFDRLDNQLRETIGNIDRQLERRAPDADILTRRLGPRAGRAVSEGLIGGAFPLLFGQGIGASAGGLAGGVAGGFAGGGLGFGLSLIGTALGTVFDTLNQAAQDTGKAFNYPIEGFEALKTAGLFASRQQEYYISKLIETGQTSRATAEIQAEMIKKIGVSGVNDLADLGDASSKLSKAWAEFNLQLQAALAGPMAGLLEWVASILELSNKGRRDEAGRRDLFMGLSDADKTAVNKKISEEIRSRGGADALGMQGVQDIRTNVLNEFKGRSTPVKAKEGKLTPEQEEANLSKAIEIADKVRSLRQQGVALERSGVDLRLSVEDTVYGLRKRATDMEREAIEFRRSVEDQIFGKRQELEQKLIENERKRQQNAIDAFDLQLQKASTGLDPIAQGVVDAARDYLRIRAEGEANLQQAEKQLKLELQRIDQEVNRYKLQVEDRVSQMAIQRDEFSRDVSRARLQIERQIADRVVQVEEYRLAMAKHRYEMEIDLEKKKQIVAQQGLAVQATGGYTGDKVDGFPITSRPGMRRHPITGETREHKGVDVAAPIGTALGYEIGGEILSAGWIRGYGNTLKVKLENGMTVLSAHLNEIFVTAGQKFQANQRLATVGSTGNSTGPHTHQESWMNGKADPYASLPFLQLGKAVSGKPGAGSDPDIYLQPGVGYFSRKTGKMVRGLTGGAGQAASAGASAQAASGASGAMGAAPVLQAAPAMPVLPSAPQLVGINDLMQQYAEIVKKIKAATAENNRIEIESNAIAAERARLALQEQAMSSVRQAEQQTREIYEEIEARKLRNRLALEGFAPEIIEGEIRALGLQRDLAKAVKGYDIVLSELIGTTYDGTTSTYESAVSKLSEIEALGQLTPAQKALREELEKILKARQGIVDATPGAVKGARDAAGASVMSPREKVEGRIGDLKKEMKELVSMDTLAIRSADAIGNAYGQAFQGLISGSMSAQEALASFFESVAESFLSMAAEIIAKQMTMIVLQTILKALGAAASASSVGSSATNFGGAPGVSFNPASFSMPALAANGATFANGIAQFARGGTFTNSIVSSPTLFQFADGGVTRMGEMGEAGPEAIMPLKRGPDGRLGVDASGMAVPYRRPAAAAATPEMEVPYQRSGAALAVPYLKSEGSAADDSMNATIDVKFETVRIGGVDYVTRDEAEQMTRESAQRGADLAHKRYRYNLSARRAAGLS